MHIARAFQHIVDRQREAEAEFFRTYQTDWTPKFYTPERQYSGQMLTNAYDLGLAGAIVGAPAVED